jgi:hypothetical protein
VSLILDLKLENRCPRLVLDAVEAKKLELLGLRVREIVYGLELQSETSVPPAPSHCGLISLLVAEMDKIDVGRNDGCRVGAHFGTALRYVADRAICRKTGSIAQLAS